MAAPGDRRDARVLQQRVHQRFWMGPNTNRAQGKTHITSGWEKECRNLRDLGIDDEELKMYTRSVRSQNDDVDDLNEEIINKVNALAGCRRSFFLLSVKKSGKQNVNNVLKSIFNLKRDIQELQRKIRDAGAVFEKMPDLFSKPVRV